MEQLLKIELVEFYELHHTKKKNGFLEGTAHVYVIDIDQDIRGLFFSHRLKDNKSFLRIPQHSQIDSEGVKQQYPIVTFVDRKKTDYLIQETKRLVTELLKKEGRI